MRPHGKVDRYFHQQCCTSGPGNTDEDNNNDNHTTTTTTTNTKEFEPHQLFIDLALLICEARQPESSERGRVQGPHCPNMGGGGGGVQHETIDSGDQQQQQMTAAAAASSAAKSVTCSENNRKSTKIINKHVCDDVNESCVRARQIEQELGQLWSRRIPACLAVSMMPEECSKSEACIAGGCALLLEKWTIQQVERNRSSPRGEQAEDGRLLPGQFLMQAVRSHLHFSQLSAWLIASRGKYPTNIVYRVCLPGESEEPIPADAASSSSTMSGRFLLSEKHRFPLSSAGKNLCLSVTVESIQRCDARPTLRPCYCLRPSTSSSAETSSTITAVQHVSIVSSSSSSEVAVITDDGGDPRTAVVRGDDDADEDDAVTISSSPLDSRSDSYQSFYDERSRSPIPIPPPPTASLTESATEEKTTLSLPHLVSDQSSSSSRYEYHRHHSQKRTFATNPLFEEQQPPIFTDAGKYSYYSASTEANTKSKILRPSAVPAATTSSSATSKYSIPVHFDRSSSISSTSGAKNRSPQIIGDDGGGKPKFFVANDDDEDDDDDEDEERREENNDNEDDAWRELGSLFDEKCDAAKRILMHSECGEKVDGGGSRKNEDEDWIVGTSSGKRTFSQSHPAPEEKDSNEQSLPSTSYATRAEHSRKVKRVLTFGGADNNVRFHPKTGLPLSSSPAPLKRNHNSFNYDPCITSVSALKSALYCYDHESGGSSDSDSGWPLCKSAPASTHLLGSFEESALNGRIKPFGTVDGFTLELGASGAFCPNHVTRPVTTLFFNVSDDNAPSPYFGLCSLESIGRRGYHVPKKGSVQATLFNPQGTVVKMFVVRYDLCEMPPSCQTFVRQRTFFMPSSASLRDATQNRSWLRYLIHLRFASSSSGKLFLHTDIRMLFSRKSELEAYNINCVDGGSVAGSNTSGTSSNSNSKIAYELRSFTETPKEPQFSPRKFNRK